MAGDLFLDTSGLYAFVVAADERHARTGAIVREAVRGGRGLVSTDYIIDETATLLKARGFGHVVGAFFDGLFFSKACRMEWMDPDYFRITKEYFVKHHDQDWSFTDCFSFIVMKNAGIKDVLTTDRHFKQAGYHPLLI